MLGVGKVFFVFFVVTLAVLTALKRRLKLEGKVILWVTLVVAIIAAFGLKAPDIFNSLKNVPTKIG
jgi:hypothetical protein